ncbi:MAG: nuclear transport factor 2 family protein [Leptospiraceae bacterium]|nr:nuclear transport factor 2 family protein [Leptospiraceae bacterium]
MHPNEELLNKFYSAFQKKDFKTMGECYADTVEFNDPVFRGLKGNAARAMWQMLIERGADLKLTFSNIKANDIEGSADWVAIYPFSKTGRTVTNRIHAKFQFKDGKIINHKDHFSLWKWAGMALGATGYFMGFLPFIQNQIKSEANTGLTMFMKRKKITA